VTDKPRNIPRVTNLRESLVQREAEICLIQQTLSEVLTDLDLKTVLDKVASRARELVNAETLLIPILSDEQDFYTYRAGAGPRVNDIIGETMPINFGVCGWVFKNKKPWWQGALEELSEDERNRWEREAGTLILVPLQGKDRMLGGISAINKRGSSDFTRRDFNLLKMFAGIVSIAIENAMTVQRLEHTNKLNEDYRRRLKILNKQLVESNKELEFHSLYDPLTSLPNRSLFRDRLTQCITQAHAARRKVGLLLIDLERFKDINDTFGHEKGDALLKLIAALFEKHTEADQTIARLGSDEYAVILPETDRDDTMKKAYKLLEAMETPFRIDGKSINVRVTIGACVFPEHGRNVTELLSHADFAMRMARNTKMGTALYDPAKDRSPMGHLTMLSDLRRAVKNEEFELFYQPQMDMRTKKITSLEALGRWYNGHYGFVRPDLFINELEQSGLIEKYTTWAIRAALAKAVELNNKHGELKISVNISVSDLMSPHFIKHLGEIVGSQTYGRLLTIEITENLFLSEYDKLFEVLEYMRYLGITLSIDDFGTGYSSLSRLKKLPVSELKIDQSFVRDMRRYKNDEVIVRSTIDLAHNLDLQVVAEGVEDNKTLKKLASLGCDVAQGYVISEPLSSEEINHFMDGKPVSRTG
jgi:diguanylate cyclase (GGDEF)-like protein